MARYWVSWWSEVQPEEVPLDYWVSGYKAKTGLKISELKDMDDDYEIPMVSSICAVIDAENEDIVWRGVAKFFSDLEQRFCEEREADYSPGGRFPGGKDRTSLV